MNTILPLVALAAWRPITDGDLDVPETGRNVVATWNGHIQMGQTRTNRGVSGAEGTVYAPAGIVLRANDRIVDHLGLEWVLIDWNERTGLSLDYCFGSIRRRVGHE